MRYSDLPFPIRLASDVWLLLGFFVISTIVLHLVLIKWKKLDKVAWKKVDYIWLLIASVALLPAATDSRRFLAKIEIEQLKDRAVTNYNVAQSLIQSAVDEWVCRESQRSEYSPPNYDEIVKEYASVCEYYKQLLNSLSEENLAKLTPIVSVEKPNVKTRSLTDSLDDLDQWIRRYNENIAGYKKLAELQDISVTEEILLVLGPLLLALALALRFTKVTGEINLERTNAERKAVDNPETAN